MPNPLQTLQPANLPKLGVCYYPEQWSESDWASDASRMAALGLTYVRIGEFAWSRIEPRDGVYEWNWLDRAVDVLGQAGLQVIMGTPTATPPRWMLAKFPDMLAYDRDGRPRGFGSRRHYCFSHEGYKQACVKIARDMGRRYANNPHIHSWQIDNEYGCHDTILSYSPAAAAAFRTWLSEKYTTIDALNKAWGNVFWSMDYCAFDEIGLPNLTVTEPNPSHVMDFRRFSSSQTVTFNRSQVDELKRLTDKPIIHNYMGRITEFDHFAVGADLDIASWDSYPMGFLEDRSDKDESFKHAYQRQGDPDFQAFHHDLYRAVGRGRWGIMEQQPGPVNWAPYNPSPLPGMVRLWSWEAIAHGAEFVNYFRWRQARSGQEQMHAGLLRPDGENSPAFDEVLQVADEIKGISLSKPEQSPIAIVFDYTSAWAWETQPQGKDFDYFRLVFDIYSALRQLGQSVDILPPNTDDFGERKLVLIPGLFSWTESLKAAIHSFAGQIMIGPRSGSKTEDFHIPKNLPPEIAGMELKVTSVESLRPSCAIALKGEGSFQFWREHVQTTEKITLEAGDGAAALVSKDNLHYLCGWADASGLKGILTPMLKAQDLPIEELADGLRRQDMARHVLYTNYGAKAAMLHGKPLQPASIRLIDKDSGEMLIS